jgi:hypothetical protein
VLRRAAGSEVLLALDADPQALAAIGSLVE